MITDILIIVHGQGRGRYVPTGGEFLRQLNQHAPDFARRIRVHETGTPLPDLSQIKLVLFWLGDPLKLSSPQCYAEAVLIAAAADQRSIPVINPPRALNNTLKSRQAAIWQDAGVPCAPVRTAQSERELQAALDTAPYPCILRSDRDHAQGEIRILNGPTEAREMTFGDYQNRALIPVKDIRAEHRKAGAKHSLYARFHHKARAIVAGDLVIPLHLFFAKTPIVCQKTCLFTRETRPRRRAARRLGFRKKLIQDMIDADLAYFSAPVAHADLIAKSVHALGLDVAAVDYSFLPDGTIYFWEANPYFSLDHGRQSVLSEERDAMNRVDQIFAKLNSALIETVPQTERHVAQTVSIYTRPSSVPSKPHILRRWHDTLD